MYHCEKRFDCDFQLLENKKTFSIKAGGKKKHGTYLLLIKFILKFILTAAGVLLAAFFLPAIKIDGFKSAVIVTAVLGILNAIVKPILILLTIPVTIITLGLFLLVINTLMIVFADYLIDGFSVDNFLWAFIFSLILSLLSWMVDGIVGDNKKLKNE